MTKGVLTSVKSQEVKLLVSPPKLVSGSILLENIQDFESLTETIRFTRVCELASFRHRVSAGMNYKTRPDEDDGFGQIIPLCRECTLFEVCPKFRAFAAIPGGTTIGPVIEVQIVKILDQKVLEIASASPNDKERTSYGMISRGKNWFVDEVHILNAELRTSAELLTELQQSGGGECVLGQSNTSNQETGAAHVSSHTGNKQTCADTLSTPPSQAFFHTQRTIPTTERKWKVVYANSSYGALSIQDPKMVTRMVRHFDQDERQSDASLHWDTTRPVLLKAFAKHRARGFSEKHWLRLIHEGSSSTRFEYFEDSKNSLAQFRAIQGHSGGTPIDPGLMEYIRIPYNWKEYSSTEVVLSAFSLSLRTDWFRVATKATKDGKRSSSRHLTLTLLVEIPTTKNLKNAESEPILRKKYKGRVVLRGDIVKDDSGAYAVFTPKWLPQK